MKLYYNDFNQHAIKWLKYLTANGFIEDGIFDDRNLLDIDAEDLDGYRQAHFFAGIGGWSYALKLAAWPDSMSVWTGSCPCQPFSSIGKRTGKDDERHLWPIWFNLIKERRPPVIFGEQVASAIGQGWLDDVSHDLEGEAYAIGAAVLPACSVGAPHTRQRLFFGAYDTRQDDLLSMDNGYGTGKRKEGIEPRLARSFPSSLPDRDFWNGGAWIPCSDGKARKIESGVLSLAHGFPGRMELVHGYGNAIVPQVAAVFIRAFMEALIDGE